MNNLVLCVALVLVFFISTAYSVTITPHYDDEKLKVVHYVLKQQFKLSCNVTDDGESGIQVKWLKNDTEITPSGRVKLNNVGITYTLVVDESNQNDAGNYTCAAYQDNNIIAMGNITASSKFLVKVPISHNVVEGEPLTIHCSTVGSPVPHLHWYYQNETFNITIKESLGRYNLSEEKGVPNSIITVSDIQMYDRGTFTCIGTSPMSTDEVSSTCMVRIKDRYAALWPFLGICAEVFVLCAVIFIYEKKRNKTELEESDTDQSPDQKNTPDHGKESNLRHRQ